MVHEETLVTNYNVQDTSENRLQIKDTFVADEETSVTDYGRRHICEQITDKIT